MSVAGAPLSVVIIGAGRMAHKDDELDGPLALTHVKGFKRHPGFEVVGICDTDHAAARAAGDRWHIAAAATFEELAAKRPEVVAVCSPDSTHETYLEAALDHDPVAVFCEKPIGLDVARAERIVASYRERGVLLAVNYSRRWWRELQPVQQSIDGGSYGAVLSASIRYHRGLLHLGSHALDLLEWFLAPTVRDGAIVDAVCDYSEADPSYSGMCVLDSARGAFTLSFEGHDYRRCAPFEVEVLFERAKVRLYEQRGVFLDIAPIARHPLSGFPEFGAPATRELDPGQAMPNAVANLHDAIRGGAALPSTGETALNTLRLCRGISSLTTRAPDRAPSAGRYP